MATLPNTDAGRIPATDTAVIVEGERSPRSIFGAVAVSKAFFGNTVLSDVSFFLRSGHTRVLLGHNGAGKTTLIKILTGVVQPDAGSIELDGASVVFDAPSDAIAAGIGVVHQDSNSFLHLDVATNIFVSQLPRSGLRFKRRFIREQAAELLHGLGVNVSPGAQLATLTPAERKIVEILRAISAGPRFLILDEPTAALDRNESCAVLDLIGQLADRGVGIACVTHRIQEALDISSHVTVLRDGVTILDGDTADMTFPEVSAAVSGGTHTAASVRLSSGASQQGNAVVEFRGVRCRADGQPIELVGYGGEILGLTGLAGSGALDLARMLVGRAAFDGEIFVAGKRFQHPNPGRAKARSLGYVPNDRMRLALVGSQSVAVNLQLTRLPHRSRFGFMRKSSLSRPSRREVTVAGIRCASVDLPVERLSGGNQQKVALAKWLFAEPRILVVETPTHGVDVGAKREIEELLYALTAQGAAVIVASTDFEEVAELSHRVAVFHDGALVEVVESGVTVDYLTRLATAR